MRYRPSTNWMSGKGPLHGIERKRSGRVYSMTTCSKRTRHGTKHYAADNANQQIDWRNNRNEVSCTKLAVDKPNIAGGSVQKAGKANDRTRNEYQRKSPLNNTRGTFAESSTAIGATKSKRNKLQRIDAKSTEQTSLTTSGGRYALRKENIRAGEDAKRQKIIVHKKVVADNRAWNSASVTPEGLCVQNKEAGKSKTSRLCKPMLRNTTKKITTPHKQKIKEWQLRKTRDVSVWRGIYARNNKRHNIFKRTLTKYSIRKNPKLLSDLQLQHH